jgi:hypothetical protein
MIVNYKSVKRKIVLQHPLKINEKNLAKKKTPI